MLLALIRITNIGFYEEIGKIIPELSSNMSRVVRKSAFCICENRDADQLRGSCAADQRLCFRFIDSTVKGVTCSGYEKITSLSAF